MKRLFIDILDGTPGPRAGDRVASVGVSGEINSVYLVLRSRRIRRRDPQAVPRWSMQVEKIEGETQKPNKRARWRWFEFQWYSRAPQRKLNFKQWMHQMNSQEMRDAG